MITTSVTKAAACLQQGQVLAYPTEAVWGLGCDPYNQQAFLEILRLKQRPIEKGVILLAGHLSQVEHLLQDLTPEMRDRVIASWTNTHPTDRATTWLLQHICYSEWITGQHPKVAVRVTNHPLCMALCHAFNGFIVSTSANPAGLAPAFITRRNAVFSTAAALFEWRFRLESATKPNFRCRNRPHYSRLTT